MPFHHPSIHNSNLISLKFYWICVARLYKYSCIERRKRIKGKNTSLPYILNSCVLSKQHQQVKRGFKDSNEILMIKMMMMMQFHMGLAIKFINIIKYITITTTTSTTTIPHQICHWSISDEVIIKVV